MFTKQNHYVPQFYQNYFCDTSGCLWVYDKDNPEPKQQHPIVTAVENHLYTINREDGVKDDSLEKEVFTRNEWIAIPVLDRWQQSGTKIQEEEIPQIASFLAFMHTRVPRNLGLMNDLWVALAERDISETASDKEQFNQILKKCGPGARDLSVEESEQLRQLMLNPKRPVGIKLNRKAALALSLGEATKIYRVLLQMHWSLCEAPTGSSFLTCDSPVVSFAPDKQGRVRFGGNFASPHLEISFPISPSLCLWIRRTEQQARRKCSSVVVNELNRRCACMAERFVYAHVCSKRIISLVKRYSYTRQQSKINRAELPPPVGMDSPAMML
ncbi:MAG: DUF4238 domain-containing protein [Verrucomicrobia bacterium]|nr:DUF4238 domain-containing protein [Verrucomicrobiota bacterium]